MDAKEARDILSSMRDQHLQFLNGVDTDKDKEWFDTFKKEAWACDAGVKALEKRIPKKLANLKEMYMDFGNGQKIKIGAYGDCPACGISLGSEVNYCGKCGQKLDWGEE